MGEVAKLNQFSQGEQLTGRVQRVEESRVWVQSEQGPVVAQTAVSCLLTPLAGDLVLLSHNRQGTYVLAILERESREYGLQVDGTLTLTADELRLHGRKTLTASAGTYLRQVAAAIESTADKISSISQQQRVQAESLEVTGQEARLSVDQVQGLFKRVYSRAEQVMRSVSLIEMLQLGNWITEVEDTHSQRAKNTVISAESDIKIDAERIHMG